ncbi:MAG TPA: heme-binding domain-containing protein [Verrucomicrobiae bacterium]|nr:heme-binding domain-containing protein [Verrucomicrobiae bacterium]
MRAEISSGEMPLKKYTKIHADARLTESQRKGMTDWLDAEAGRLDLSTTK